MKKTKPVLLLLIHMYIVISMLICLLRFAFATGDGNMSVHGFKAFQYFTVESNFLMAIASGFMICHIIKQFKNPEHRIPHWLELFVYIATNAVAVTFVTVCVILGPAAGFFSMFTGNNFMMHLVNPVAAILAFLFLQKNWRITWPQTFFAIVTTVIYGIIYYVMVVRIGAANGGWEDFYYFNRNGMWYISYIVMQILAYILAMCLRAVHNRRLPSTKKPSEIDICGVNNAPYGVAKDVHQLYRKRNQN